MLERGFAGGAEAAQRILNSVQSYIAKYDGARDWRLVVRVFVNMDYLTRRTQSEGLMRDGNLLRQFALGFTQSQPSFEMIDAGQGKDRVAYKIKGELQNDIITL